VGENKKGKHGPLSGAHSFSKGHRLTLKEKSLTTLELVEVDLEPAMGDLV
jgi:hypothetical protein